MRDSVGGGGHIGLRVDKVFGSPVAPAKLVGAGPPSDRKKPRSGGSVAAESAQRGEGPKVGLLRKIVGCVPVHQVRAEPPHISLARADERANRIAVTPSRRASEKGEFVHDEHASRPLFWRRHPGSLTPRELMGGSRRLARCDLRKRARGAVGRAGRRERSARARCTGPSSSGLRCLCLLGRSSPRHHSPRAAWDRGSDSRPFCEGIGGLELVDRTCSPLSVVAPRCDSSSHARDPRHCSVHRDISTAVARP